MGGRRGYPVWKGPEGKGRRRLLYTVCPVIPGDLGQRAELSGSSMASAVAQR